MEITGNRKSPEDIMIERLRQHKALKLQVITDLRNMGIKAEETLEHTNKYGDIKIPNPSDISRVKQYIKELHKKYNG
jgi:hypothetical protein